MAKKKYVTNKELRENIFLYHETGVIPEKLHLMLYEMAKRIGSKPNFVNYTFKDDMISDSYLRCLKALDKYDTDRMNAFGYFTTVIHNFFSTTITKSKKQGEIKERLKEKLYDEITARYTNTVNVKALFDEESSNNFDHDDR